MTSSLKSAACLSVALGLSATQAQACGELMLRSLDTMRYHAFVTHHAAAIVLYVGDAAGAPVPADAMALHDALERTGHKVTVVRGSDELSKILAARHYDVVISDSDDLAKVSARWDGGGHPKEPALVPVLSRGADERVAKERFPLLVSGGMRDLLKAIEQAMKAAEL